VLTEQSDPDSILNFYKHLIALRRDLPALHDGSYIAVNREDPNVLAYLRRANDGTDPVLVALNMSAEEQTVNFALEGFGAQGSRLHVLLAAPLATKSEFVLPGMKLEPFGVLIARVE
jgi:glycosidase